MLLATLRELGDWRRGYALVNELRRSGGELDGPGLEGLLGACGRAGRPQEALNALKASPSVPGLLGWFGLLEACAAEGDSKRRATFATAAMEAVNARGGDIASTEPLVAAAATAAFGGSPHGLEVAASVLSPEVTARAADAPNWKEVARALEGLRRSPGVIDLHGVGRESAKTAVAAIVRDLERAGASEGYPSLVACDGDLLVITGRGKHAQGNGGVPVVKAAVLEELKASGIAVPSDEGDGEWTPTRNPGVVLISSGDIQKRP